MKKFLRIVNIVLIPFLIALVFARSVSLDNLNFFWSELLFGLAFFSLLILPLGWIVSLSSLFLEWRNRPAHWFFHMMTQPAVYVLLLLFAFWLFD